MNKTDAARRLLSPRNERTDNNSSLANKSTTDAEAANQSPKKTGSPSKSKAPPVTLIVKPDCQSQGRGIFLTNDID